MVTIKIKTDNAAFADDYNAELAKILRELADKISLGYSGNGVITLRDTNGNTVGTANP